MKPEELTFQCPICEKTGLVDSEVKILAVDMGKKDGDPKDPESRKGEPFMVSVHKTFCYKQWVESLDKYHRRLEIIRVENPDDYEGFEDVPMERF